MPGREGSRDAERGTTLVELVVALAVLLVALLLATQLLLESVRLFAASGARANDPAAALAADRLREDLRAASATDGLPGSGPLVLLLPSGAEVSWRPTGDRRLVRAWRRGGVEAERTELAGVTSWRWSQLAGGLVEVVVEVDTSGSGFVRWLTGLRPTAPGPGTERLDVVARLRGGGGSGGGGW